MTTISSNALQGLQLIPNTSVSSDNSVAAQIAQITKKITELTKSIKDVASGDGSAEEKNKQLEMIQSEIQMLEAQLAQLQRKQAEAAQQGQALQPAGATTGVNSPSDDRQIDIYI